MRKIVTKLLAALMVAILSMGVAVGADSPAVREAEAHPIPSGTPSTWAWCTWRMAEYGLSDTHILWQSRFIHYGDAHVYQCHMRTCGNSCWGTNFCMQEVEWYGFLGPAFYNGDPYESYSAYTVPCW